MAAGTTVVASALDGYRNVATHEQDALLVEPGDAGALAASIQRALDDDDLTERLRANGSLRALDFSMSTLVDHYIRIYRDLIA